jgi:transposase
MICGATTNGVQVTRCIQGSANTAEFLAFIDELSAACPQRFVLMDNVSFHKATAVQDALRRAGKTAIFTPPYCPDLNPIEHIFSSIKHVYRQFNHFACEEDGRVTPDEVDLVMDVWRTVCDTANWTKTFMHSLNVKQRHASIADEGRNH